MSKSPTRLLTLAIGLLVAFGIAAQAHHSYVTKYDPAKKIRLRGTITSVSYFNPHIFFNVSVPNRGGGESEWRIETESIQMTRARGLSQAKLKVGRKVMLTGWRARSGGAEVGLSTIKFASSGWINIRSRPR